MTDEREGKPSASVLPRLALCPGSWQKTRGLPEIARPELAEWANSGDRVHLWLEDPSLVELSPDEMKVALRCKDARDKLVYQIYPDWDAQPGQIMLEQRLWLTTNGVKVFSGQLDFSVAGPERRSALIVDFKSNRGEHENSESNLQLRAQAVLLWNFMLGGPDIIHVAIVQPLVAKPILCAYDRESLKLSYQQINVILAEANKPNAPLNPGKAQCQYCPARLTCEVAWKESVQAINAQHPAFLEGAALSKMLDQWQLAKAIGKDLEARVKKLLRDNPEAVPNWSLKDGANVRSIPEPYALFNLMHKAGMVKSPKEFIQRYCKVGIGTLEDTIEKETVNQLFAPAIKLETKEASLKRL